MRSAIVGAVVSTIAAFVLCGVVVGFDFATQIWYVFILGSAIGLVIQFALQSRCGSARSASREPRPLNDRKSSYGVHAIHLNAFVSGGVGCWGSSRWHFSNFEKTSPIVIRVG